jgi:hypothetical protein
MTDMKLFKTNKVDDSGYTITTEEIARLFWASDEAKRWQTEGVFPLERLALNWVPQHLGQWENLPRVLRADSSTHTETLKGEDWDVIFEAIHAARPSAAR